MNTQYLIKNRATSRSKSTTIVSLTIEEKARARIQQSQAALRIARVLTVVDIPHACPLFRMLTGFIADQANNREQIPYTCKITNL